MLLAKKHILKISKGIFIGIGVIIPGLSGGTAAILCGEFENILSATSNMFKTPIKSLKQLVLLGFGAVFGIVISAPQISYICLRFPIFAKAIFCVITLVSASAFFVKQIKFTFSSKKLLLILSGLISALFVSYLLDKTEFFSCSMQNTALFLVGFPLSLALVLPAISFSYMLLYFGLYEDTINAIVNFEVGYILYLLSGLIIGTFISSKLLLSLINKHSKETYSFVFGFVIFSIFDIFIR